MRVLIVDDDSVDRKLLKRTLNSSQYNFYDIVECSSVSDGLNVIKEQSFDVILLDYTMPEANGIEMLHAIRSQLSIASVAIIMISGIEDNALMLDCLEAGAQDFISKNEITTTRLQKAILHAKKRFEIEKNIQARYVEVKEMAEKDPLTGISNRYHFDENLQLTISNNKRTEHQVALLTFDIDNFKHINDTMGHCIGDSVLIEAVNRTKACLRSNEDFARLGGDEFAIVLGDITSENEVSIIAKRILNTFNDAFIINDKEIHCSISIGAAMYPASSPEVNNLLKCADIALYYSKNNGKNKISFYQANYQSEFNRRFTIENAIKDVLNTSSFRLFYQPIYSGKNDTLMGFEALIRWPEANVIYTPDEFIPIAEESQLINQISEWVIIEAITQLSHWQCQFNKELTMSINISPVQLLDNQLVEFLANTIDKHAISAEKIILEITETALIKENKKIAEVLSILSNMGYQIALDDFGMGFSSIAHLMEYPINIVKLDKSMQTNDGSENKHRKIFEALSLMLKKLSFSIVAEGIELEQQLALCKKLQIDKIQGYLLGRPLDKTMTTAILSNNIK